MADASVVNARDKTNKHMSRGQNQLFTSGTRIKVIAFFWGGLSLSSVLFKTTLNNAKMQGNWLHGFRSKLPGMD